MDNLGIILRMLYKKVPVQSVLENKIEVLNFNRETFQKMAVSYIPNYSENETENLFSYYVNLFREHSRLNGRKESNKLNVFDALFYYTEDCLTIQNNQVLCRYHRLPLWRQMTLELSEDLLVASYLAQEDLDEHEVMQRGFCWKRVIGHNNVQLNHLVERGISENHFHLYGSGPIFHISWLSLMNNVNSSNMAKHLTSYGQARRYTNLQYDSEYREESFYHRYLQAALIRILLYSKITGKRMLLGSYRTSVEVLFRVLKFPQIRTDQEQKVPTRVLEELIQDSEGDIYTLDDLLSVLYFQKVPDSVEDKKKIAEKLREDPFYQKLIESRISRICVSGKNIRRKLKKYESDVTEKELTWLYFACVEEIKMEDIPFAITDKRKFLEEWEKQTREKVFLLLNHPSEIEDYIDEIQEIIDSFRYPPTQLTGIEERKMDYLLNQTEHNGAMITDPCFIFSGERWLLYTMMHKIYMADRGYEPYFGLFYAYVLIKESIRSEMVQINDKVGFQNFQRYQSRKADFLEDAIYREHSVKLTLKECLVTENIRTTELRIAPRETAEEIRTQIIDLDDQIDPERKFSHQFFYTYHFIKQADKPEIQDGFVPCRHAALRKRLRCQAGGIIQVRENYPEAGKRILGIDAAASEIGCRPEVFGEIFRELKKHTAVCDRVGGEYKLPQIRATYHVGEDFLDLADGLRAIDEAVHFLNLDCGDRLGHALALGVDAEKWYKIKNYHVILPKQDYLDNLVWVYQKLTDYNIQGYENLKDWIEEEFSGYFGDIYRKHIHAAETKAIVKNTVERYKNKIAAQLHMEFDINTYYMSMKLRGDDPEFYSSGYFDEREYLQSGRKQSIRRKMNPDNRYMPWAVLLYYHYHFNEEVRKEGNKTIQVNIKREYVKAVAEIQKSLQREIAGRGIAIETNPSSNYLIGTFRSYEKHPIIQFYNQGLTTDSDELAACPQISVSINTDDQGVFSTSLENEYALLASSLEGVTDENGNHIYKKAMIYDWLDKIRIMGNEQSFGFKLYEEHGRKSGQEEKNDHFNAR